MYQPISVCVFLVALTFCLANGCGGNNSQTVGIAPAVVDLSPTTDDLGTEPDPGGIHAGFPAFPDEGYSGEFSLIHTASEAEETVTGDGFIDGMEQGDNNGPGSLPGSYVIAPGDNDDLAYAVYGITGLDADRPVGMAIEVQGVPILPGGDDELDMFYWVGLSNYTTYQWEWQGPFSEPQYIVLNSVVVRDRYVNAGGTGDMYFAIVAMADEEFITEDNPLGLTGVQVNSSVLRFNSQVQLPVELGGKLV